MVVRMQKTESLIQTWEESKMKQPFWKTFWLVLKKLNIQLPYNATNLLLDV